MSKSSMMPPPVSLAEYLMVNHEKAVAWDRDNLNIRWAKTPTVYPALAIEGQPFVTDGYGHSIYWEEDELDPLGGHWKRYNKGD